MSLHDPAFAPGLARFGDVAVNLSVELGRSELPLREVLALTQGSVVSLDRLTHELLDVTANGKVIARGEVVAENGRFALRIVSLADGAQAPPRPRPVQPMPPQAAPEPAAPPPPPPSAAVAPPEPEVSPLDQPVADEDPLGSALDDIFGGEAAPGGAA